VPGLIQESKKTVWVLGDQLNRDFAALAQATPSTHRVLMVESSAKVRSKKWHIQRAHFVITAMRRFAQELWLEVGVWKLLFRLFAGLQANTH
jgi:deoxyribodipyrimidine photolyase-related protein